MKSKVLHISITIFLVFILSNPMATAGLISDLRNVDQIAGITDRGSSIEYIENTDNTKVLHGYDTSTNTSYESFSLSDSVSSIDYDPVDDQYLILSDSNLQILNTNGQLQKQHAIEFLDDEELLNLQYFGRLNQSHFVLITQFLVVYYLDTDFKYDTKKTVIGGPFTSSSDGIGGAIRDATIYEDDIFFLMPNGTLVIYNLSTDSIDRAELYDLDQHIYSGITITDNSMYLLLGGTIDPISSINAYNLDAILDSIDSGIDQITLDDINEQTEENGSVMEEKDTNPIVIILLLSGFLILVSVVVYYKSDLDEKIFSGSNDDET